MRKLVPVVMPVVAVVALGFAAAAVAGTAKATYSFKAALTAAQEVPKPVGAKASAGGTFTGRTVEASSGSTFRWKLTFHGLTGKAVAAHVHLGAKGKAGAVLIPLCGPCKNGQTGTVKITSKIENAMEKGGTYVNVHTPKNPNGEIRGQLKLVGP